MAGQQKEEEKHFVGRINGLRYLMTQIRYVSERRRKEKGKYIRVNEGERQWSNLACGCMSCLIR
jgi:hypothetical protein